MNHSLHLFAQDPVPESELLATFRSLDLLPLAPDLYAIGVSICLHLGAGFALAGSAIPCVLFLMSGWAVAVRSARRYRVPIRRSAQRRRLIRRRIAWAASALILMLVAAVAWYRLRPIGGSGLPVALKAPESEPEDAVAEIDDDIYEGVILIPEPADHAVLVPPLPVLPRNLFAAKDAKPLSIPFYGVYWMFRRPRSQPPPGSYVAKGSPLTSVFRSTNRRALQMEAHQNFGRLIDLSCCSQIQLAILSVEGQTSLALTLTNTMLSGSPSQDLGPVRIPASGLRRGSEDPPISMVLTYRIPERPKIQQFDEATVAFNREYATASAKVAIERFVFVPR